MNFSLATLSGQPADEDLRRAARLGAACQLAARSGPHGGRTLKTFVDAMRMPARLDQWRLYFNDFGQCMGYVTWAFLAPEVEQRILQSGNMRLEDFEWNEGPSAWVMDLLVPEGALLAVLRDLRDHVFAECETLTYARFRRGRPPVFKRVSRCSVSAFWKPVSG